MLPIFEPTIVMSIHPTAIYDTLPSTVFLGAVVSSPEHMPNQEKRTNAARGCYTSINSRVRVATGENLCEKFYF
jgi:hypothetical protein